MASVGHAGAAGGERFKQGMRRLVGSVNVVALQGLGSEVLGVTATAVCSLSAQPPSLLASINLGSRLSAGFVEGAFFSVNVLAADQEEIAQAFGGRLIVAGRARFNYGEWYRSEHDVPLLAGARASFECRVERFMDYGSHRVAVGLVTDVHLDEEDAPSLVFGGGRYHAVG